MFKIDHFVKAVIPWVLFGFGIVYLSQSFTFAGIFFALAIYFLFRKPANASDGKLKQKNIFMRLTFLILVITMAFMANMRRDLLPPDDISLWLMLIILYVSIGVLIWSFIKELFNT